jgi:hypothetical protein
MSSWFSKILSHREIASHRKDNTVCDQCGQKFEKYDELIAHARHVHHHPIVNAMMRQKNSFMRRIGYTT